MRALLSSVGTRGDVQPIVALALKVRDLGHDVRLCVPPNFVEWVRGFGFEAASVGVVMRHPVGRSGGESAPPITAEQLRRMRESMPDLITDQFDAVGEAAEGCDVIVGANAHQYAARSIAELRGVRYVTALYAPVAIPSPDHAPPPAPGETWAPGDAAGNAQRWAESAHAWNDRALERVNDNRSRRGLAPIDDVLRYNITDLPWLAADAALAPAPTAPSMEVFQTGAWILEDATPLAPELEDFLEKGEPPLYIGFGSMPAPGAVSRTLVDAARAVGRRVILSRGWAELSLIDGALDCTVVGDVNHQALFPRVAAVVHHGGAGTTAAAARAAAPQVLAPMFGDQFYWASRVRALGIGSSVVGALTTQTLASALREALEPAVALRSRSVARLLPPDGTTVAARRLVALSSLMPVGPPPGGDPRSRLAD
ncbi:MAG TPA: glycosyltransferase [Polyangiaceae bacterium]|nr:glycosyltransferase [Polyangiaceae bacterium]